MRTMHDVKTKRNGLIIELQCDDIKEDNPVMSQPGLSDVTLQGRGDATGAQLHLFHSAQTNRQYQGTQMLLGGHMLPTYAECKT